MFDRNISLAIIDILLALMITMMAYFVGISFDKYSGNFSSDFTLVEIFDTVATDIDGKFGTVTFIAIVLEYNNLDIYEISGTNTKHINTVNSVDKLIKYTEYNNHLNYIIYENKPSKLFDKIIREFALRGINFGIAQLAK